MPQFCRETSLKGSERRMNNVWPKSSKSGSLLLGKTLQNFQMVTLDGLHLM